MEKTEARQKIRRLADELAEAMTFGGEDYDVIFHRMERTCLESPGREYAYAAMLRVVTQEDF